MTTTTGIISATAHGSTCHFASILPFSGASSFTVKPKRRNFSSRVWSALLPQKKLESRRLVSLSLVYLHLFSLSKDAMGATAFDKYVKKKRLDPLEAYIPALLLTGLQIRELGQYLEADQPKYADCRNLLRSGPASSLRINIRAVAQYASDAGNGKTAFNEVDLCLRAIEELDSLLLRASRNESGTSIDSMKAKVVTALDALNGLLETVPAEALDKGKAMADAYIMPGEDLAPQNNIDPQLKQLESIL
ncbi:hypothetical protein ACS0TY_020648 [Phlomoides rotata]